MIRHRLALTTAGCLLFLAGIAHGEPVADQAAVSAPPVEEVWGDPEATGTSEPGWTWFGMGYERRARQRSERTAEPLATPDEISGSNGNARGGK